MSTDHIWFLIQLFVPSYRKRMSTDTRTDNISHTHTYAHAQHTHTHTHTHTAEWCVVYPAAKSTAEYGVLPFGGGKGVWSIAVSQHKIKYWRHTLAGIRVQCADAHKSHMREESDPRKRATLQQTTFFHACLRVANITVRSSLSFFECFIEDQKSLSLLFTAEMFWLNRR